MNHKNNVQTSIEEFEVIRGLMKEMIGLEFDDGGKKRKLTVDDFLIVSPYNTQVNLLISKFFKKRKILDRVLQNIPIWITLFVSIKFKLEYNASLSINNNLKIAIEANFVNIGLYDQIKASLPYVLWEKVDDIIGVIAAVKDADEIESLKTAVEITDAVFTEIIPELKIGATEKKIGRASCREIV